MTEVRFALDGELQQYLEIRKEIFVREQGFPEEAEIDEYDCPAPDRHILLFVDGIACGTARIADMGGGTVRYQRVCVLRERRKTGMGLILIAGVDALARSLGYRKAFLEAQIQAEGFYRKCGFSVEDPEIVYDCGRPHVRMSKPL